MPADQAHFLLLLDQIGLPHEDKKQLHGATLEIIGLVIDLKDMSISMSGEAKQNLIESIHDFILNTPDNKCQQPLRAWLRMLGYANWALNAFPILKPALNSSYDKISGKVVLNQGVYVNKPGRADLLCVAHSLFHFDDFPIFASDH